MKCNQSRPGLELVSPCSFPTAITTTPRAPPMKGYSAFAIAPALLERHHQIISYHILDTRQWRVSYLSAEMQLVYPTALAD